MLDLLLLALFLEFLFSGFVFLDFQLSEVMFAHLLHMLLSIFLFLGFPGGSAVVQQEFGEKVDRIVRLRLVRL